ncbi:MAG TPA: BNR-4 repeat-containing protein [Phycisphaerae bacterium]|nr:BNR-4 repeat-containing protein [Phycisphaerae bacterium]HOJ72467.1 BNR-4 repeat-containing protein [Phycisphaerae bacterium]HOM49871.1 BNR-4 repeat-containing protein [Phycisphaerae bacterium]HON65481.1 BNR-4 repeat-containing protein [Phycisphaerae bacterium]HOQ84715.1 BNR-4 repeat-containing protein [Phycisphaerae bacterium]
MNTTSRTSSWQSAGTISLLTVAFLVACLVGGARAADAKPKPPQKGVALDGKTAFSVPAKELGLKADAITVAAWVKLADVKKSQVFANCGRANSAFTFYVYNGAVRMLIGPDQGSYAFATAPLPEPGVWTHYAGTYDGKQIRIYRNGTLETTVQRAGPMQAPAGDVFIGALNSTERFLTGEMDDVRIWRRTLNDAEVAAVVSGTDDAGADRDLAGRWIAAGLTGDAWKCASQGPAATRVVYVEPKVILNQKDTGYRGIWYMNQPSGDEYVYKYSGGMGTYCANHIPHAWYAAKVNKTFFTYGGAAPGNDQHLIHMVSYFDHNTGLVPRPTILLDKKTNDAHDNPVINLDDQGYIWIFSSSHGQSRPSYISRSKKPYDIEEFELVWTGNFSYPQPWYMPGHGFLFMHTFYQPGRSICMMTSPDGVNWSERRLLSYIDEGHYQVSRPLTGGRIGTFFNHHPKGKGLNWRTNVYYMETDDFGKTWKSADGTVLELPLKEIENPALVHDYRDAKLNMYTQDLTCDSQGRPVLMYVTSKGYESGPKNMPRTWTIARWTGSKWEIHGGDIISDNNYDFGSLYIESDDLWRIIGPTQVGPQPYNPGGEIAMWISTDQGRHWKMVRQMTSGSEYNHTFVRRPVNAHPDFYGFWADGHGRRPSDSRLYFCNKAGDVFRLPVVMTADSARPERIN